jgi:hypothetical protein
MLAGAARGRQAWPVFLAVPHPCHIAVGVSGRLLRHAILSGSVTLDSHVERA